MIRIKSDKIVLTDSLYDGYVYIKNGKIVEVSKDEKAAEKGEKYIAGKIISRFNITIVIVFRLFCS